MIRSVTILLISIVIAHAQLYYPGQPLVYHAPPVYKPAVVAAPRVLLAPTVKYAPPPVAYAPVAKVGSADKDASTVQEYRDVSFDGNFNFGFDSNNGLSVKSKGYVKPPPGPNQEPVQVIEGSYSYVDPTGKSQTVNYIADEAGYRAYGDGIVQPEGAAPPQAPQQQR